MPIRDTRYIRNIAIIAHVDHGKTTLVDCMLKYSGLFREHEAVGECILDSNDQERERGITILAKNIAIDYKGFHINLIDTPGHSDFGGEVERVLRMADACLLLIDAFEGPMPQTKFVLQKAFMNHLRPIVIVNKCDRPNARPDEALDETFGLFCELNASDEQLDFPVVYASGKESWAAINLEDERKHIGPLLDLIIEKTPPPTVAPGDDMSLLVSTLMYNEFVGRIAVGRVFSGVIERGQLISVINRDGEVRQEKVERLYAFEGLNRVETTEIGAGDICAISGIRDIGIGDTIATVGRTEPIETIVIDKPTVMMEFRVNDSPFAGNDGKHVTSRKLRERPFRELESNVALRVEPTDDQHVFIVSGRGLLHLGVFIETMRREGYELAVGKPHVIMKEVDGMKYEPIERVSVDVPEEYVGKVIELFGIRGGTMEDMTPRGATVFLTIICPTRGLIGIRNRLMSITRGEAIVSHVFDAYEPYRGALPHRQHGVIISSNEGDVTNYSLINLQDRGSFFVRPGDRVYEGQIVGQTRQLKDITVNATRKKELTNIRSATKEIDERLNAVKSLGLEEALEFIEDDELVEVTPLEVRMRKRERNEKMRLKSNRKTDD